MLANLINIQGEVDLPEPVKQVSPSSLCCCKTPVLNRLHVVNALRVHPVSLVVMQHHRVTISLVRLRIRTVCAWAVSQHTVLPILLELSSFLCRDLKCVSSQCASVAKSICSDILFL
jgi:hypothetical protein